MLSVIVASLLGLAVAKECQYVLYQDTYMGYLPLAINRCHYLISDSQDLQQSMQFTCLTETAVKVSYFDKTFDCTGQKEEEIWNSTSAFFDCSSEKLECGKLFGLKTPCDCTKEDGNCDYAFAYSVVDETCVSLTYPNTGVYQKWAITCGSVDKANAVYGMYSDIACNSELGTETINAGCYTSDTYDYAGNNEVDRIICPANIHTFSITMIVALIVAALSL